jgi:toxin ParE1/3/4
MRLDYTLQALADLEAIADYLKPLNPQAAGRARAAILDLLQKLVMFPHLGRSQTAKGVRKLTQRKYKYLIYYHVNIEAEIITILTIQHGAQPRKFADA